MILIKNRLNAGFFSNFNAVLGWYWYSMRTDIPIHIQWDGSSDRNIFNTFFQQKYKYEPHEFEHNGNFQHSPLFTNQIKNAFKEDVGEKIFNKYDNGWFFCQGKIYVEPEFSKLRELYNYIYTENLKLKLELIPHCNIPQKTLGVMYRYLKMYTTNDDKKTPLKNIISIDEYHNKYLKQIESTFENGNYENIYVASSHRIFFERCKQKFKDKIIYIKMDRLEEDLWEIHRNVSLEKEFTDVLTDVVNLTKCDRLLMSPSNITFATLYMNPHISYDIFDFLVETYTG